MVKLKDLLNEVASGYKNRQFGDPLPTLADVTKEYQKKHQELKEETLEESPDNDLYRSFKAINNDIVRIINKFGKKADVDKALHTWMVGLQASLKKMGYKL
jgi:hypothetical protein